MTPTREGPPVQTAGEVRNADVDNRNLLAPLNSPSSGFDAALILGVSPPAPGVWNPLASGSPILMLPRPGGGGVVVALDSYQGNQFARLTVARPDKSPISLALRTGELGAVAAALSRAAELLATRRGGGAT